MKKDKHSVYAIGTPTIVVVLIVLCLITFAALSLVSAKADYNLSKTYAASTNAYYAASTKAQGLIRRVDARLLDIYGQSGDAFLQAAAEDAILASYGKVYIKDGSCYINIKEKISEKSELDIVLQIKSPGKNSECFDIISYKQMSSVEWNADDNMNVYVPE